VTLEHRPGVKLLLAHRRHHAAGVAALGVGAVDDRLLVHLKRIVARRDSALPVALPLPGQRRACAPSIPLPRLASWRQI
jgi:hypothetical protein